MAVIDVEQAYLLGTNAGGWPSDIPSAPQVHAVAISEPPLEVPTAEELPHYEAEAPVRRPVRGIQLKGETFARISLPTRTIYDSSGQPANGPDSAQRADPNNPKKSPPAEKYVGLSTRYANFILQSVSIDREEKFQSVPTFGLSYGFFFGERPHIYSFNAVLVDSGDFRWVSDWLGNYDDNFRGTRLAERNTPVTVEFEDHVIEGYIIKSVLNKDASTPLYMQMGFTMWVTSHTTPQHGAGDTRTQIDARGTPVQHRTPFSTTDAVRSANLALLKASQSPGWLRKAADWLYNAKNSYDNVVQGVENFLYNRNIVPANQYATFAPTVAEATAALNQLRGGITYKVPAPYELRSKGFNFENRDEYLLGGWIDALESYGSADPTALMLANGNTATAAALVAEGNTAWANKAARLPVTLSSETLLEKIGKVVLSRAVLLTAQVLLQEDGIVAMVNGSVEGTMLGDSKKLKFVDDIALPSLHTLEILAVDSVGARTVTDRLRTQVQRNAELERQSTSRGADRSSRLQALQTAANAILGVTSSTAVSDAALEEQLTATRAAERQQQQLTEAARNAQRAALLRDFAS